MNSIERQTEILSQLSQILHDDADEGYNFAIGEFDYLPEYETISNYFLFEKDSVKVNRPFSDDAVTKNLDLCEELRALMKEHTGGEWKSFTLTIDADGKAKAKFHYPESKTE